MKGSPPPQTFPPRLIGLLAALTLAWGSNWPVMKIVLSEMPPMHFRTLCLLFGGIGLFIIARQAVGRFGCQTGSGRGSSPWPLST